MNDLNAHTSIRGFYIKCHIQVLVCILSLLFFWTNNSVSYALSGLPTATLEANPNIILADGRSISTVTVTLNDGTGHAPPDGTQVHLVTTSGTLSSDVAVVAGGIVRVTLTSSPIAGHATVTASFISPNGSAQGATVVEFTADSAIANTDQVMSNWIRIRSNQYMAYCADFRTIDMAGKNRGVRIAYRGLTIDANSAQLDLDSDTVRAQNASLSHNGSSPLYVDSLIYHLDDASGEGVQANAPGTHTIQLIQINGYDLQTKVLKGGGGESESNYEFRDLSAGHVLITATTISAQPHNQIQLARASIYMDGKHIVSMPNQVMPIDTNQPFGQQIIGYGTSGFFLDVPYYASLTPKSTGMFSLRSEPASVQAGTGFPNRPEYAVDYDRSYNDGRNQSDFKINGLTTPNWGVRWTESTSILHNTSAYLFFDSPQHQSLFSSANIRHDFKIVAASINLTSTAPFSGSNTTISNTQNVTADLSTPSHIFFGSARHGLLYALDANFNLNQSKYQYSNGTFESKSITHGYGLRMYTPPIIPNSRISITDSVSMNQTYLDTASGQALEVTGNLQITATPSRYSHTSLGMTYTHNPLIGAVPQPIVVNNTLLGQTYKADSESFNWNYGASAAHGIWDLTLGSTYGLPTKSLTFDSGLNYRLSSQMHLGLGSYYSQFLGYGYSDYSFSLSHRLGLKDIVVSWSALLHHWEVNLADAQF